MIAVDTLVHNFLHRTGILRRFRADHAYGLACYRPGGCAEIIEAVAHQIDARQFDRRFPRAFPRFVQHAIWRYCSQQVLGDWFPRDGSCFPDVDSDLILLALRRTDGHDLSSRYPCGATYPESE
jgi:hypothetical protein